MNLTGKRRIAFASYVDENYLPGFLNLLRSLALTNPGICEDFIVLYDDLQPSSLTAIRKLHPRIVARPVVPSHYDEFVKGDPENYLVRKAYFILDVFRIRDYDTIITLDTDMVVLGDLSELMELRHGFAAVPQFHHQQTKLNSGLLVIQREFLTDEFAAIVDETGRSGKYELDKHDQGILNALLENEFIRLDAKYNYVKRRAQGDDPLPDDIAILHFTGRHKPWNGGESGYAVAEAAWHRYRMNHAQFITEFLALKGERHPDLLIHFGKDLVARGGDTDALCDVAQAYLDKGRYEEAVRLLTRSRLPAQRSRPHELLGIALAATSRYDEAEARLLLATAEAGTSSRVFGRLAEMSWVRGDDEAAHAYALQGLGSDSVVDRKCRIMYKRTSGSPAPSGQAPVPGDQLAHVAFYMDRQGNAGDKILPESVRQCFGPETGPARWHSQHAHRMLTEEALREINRRRGLVIGGGGLFIPDTMPNGNSAWQWNVPDDLLKRIDVPLAVFAVGYNAFDGQSYTRTRFTESLKLLAAKSSFFGLRNHGSVDKVRELLPAELRDRVVFQPCPTTVSRHIVPGWQDPVRRAETVLLNCAYDRAGLRFGYDYDQFVEQMAQAVLALGDHAEVRYAAHALDDERFVHDLRRVYGISLPVEPMYDWDTDQLRAGYANTRLVIGMRGHAGMVPFGVGTPIISLISHPKMAYFLQDIGRPEWGVSVHDRRLGELLTEKAVGLIRDNEAAIADVHRLQEPLWEVTRENAAKLNALFAA
ncbi:hypothetical protein SRB5_64340 [Streptomyces sp. RB5]|uniref:Polysaccharide pyruvyl transferase domain-containing protein n=1 Tax=Streptomyces smaragdinus TaxID=2585196 RepID=A0A7K0CRW3_9ACTN|nr:glycosyltransferase [Streptomyces smaragdinus]MQY16236.1 hypothetical protein [Streptomyces smaragdinus]